MSNPFQRPGSGNSPFQGSSQPSSPFGDGQSPGGDNSSQPTQGFGQPSGGQPGGPQTGPPQQGGKSHGFGAPGSSPSQDFNSQATSTARRSSGPTTGPWSFVIGAVVAAVIGVILGVVNFAVFTSTQSGWLWMSLAGWVLCGIVAFILVGLYVREDIKRQAEGFYLSNPTQKLMQWGAFAIGWIGVVITAIEIALWFGKAFGA